MQLDFLKNIINIYHNDIIPVTKRTFASPLHYCDLSLPQLIITKQHHCDITFFAMGINIRIKRAWEMTIRHSVRTIKINTWTVVVKVYTQIGKLPCFRRKCLNIYLTFIQFRNKISIAILLFFIFVLFFKLKLLFKSFSFICCQTLCMCECARAHTYTGRSNYHLKFLQIYKIQRKICVTHQNCTIQKGLSYCDNNFCLGESTSEILRSSSFFLNSSY